MVIIMMLNLTDYGLENINSVISICKNYLKFLSKQNVTLLIDEYKKKKVINFLSFTFIGSRGTHGR